MSKLRYIMAIALVGLLGVATVYLCCSVIDEGIQRRTKETTPESETEIDELVFIPIESTISQVHEVNDDGVFEEICAETEPENQEEIAQSCEFLASQEEKNYSSDDLMLLARLIMNEAGSDFASDEHQRAVASVAMNRVNDPRFPDTLENVIMQGQLGECQIQYAIGSLAAFMSLEVSDRAYANAEYVLTYGSTVGDAVWQSESVQGEIVATFSYPGWDAVTYIGR